MKHCVTLNDYSPSEVQEILHESIELKSAFKLENRRDPVLNRCVAAMIFEKQSLRTRVSFETGLQHLGGHCLYLSGNDVGWGGKRESMKDFSSVLGSYVDLIICRAKSHESVLDLARYSNRPVINALTDLYHPCQALADILTVMEYSDDIRKEKIAFIGDANNVSRSLAIACAKLNISYSIAGPEGYQFEDSFLEELRDQNSFSELTQETDPFKAVADASFVYTDVWTSMGQESEQQKRRSDFEGYQVNRELMNGARENAKFLHCLPAIRGEEVTDEVMDDETSLVIRQAENRMHAQKGLMTWLMRKNQRSFT